MYRKHRGFNQIQPKEEFTKTLIKIAKLKKLWEQQEMRNILHRKE